MRPDRLLGIARATCDRFAGPRARHLCATLWREDAALAAGLVVGVIAMILHWS